MSNKKTQGAPEMAPPRPAIMLDEMLSCEDHVHNLSQGIRQALYHAADHPEEPVHIFRYLPEMVDFIYVLARHEQQIKEARFKEGIIHPEDYTEEYSD